jgi:crotonobetainyl-CoA:carnitine CoA-transferase CaiB-like acyl-CoA transferase
VVACANDATWQRLRGCLDLPDRPEWRTNADRVADRETLMGHLGAVLSAMTVAQAEQRLTAARVPAGPVLTPDQTLAHPAVERIRVEHHHFGTIELPGPAMHTATTRAEHDAPPALGAHRDEILHELELSAGQIATLARAGAFGPAAPEPA